MSAGLTLSLEAEQGPVSAGVGDRPGRASGAVGFSERGEKIFFRAPRSFALLKPRPRTRGTRRVFWTPEFPSPTYFRFAHGLAKKIVSYIETNHDSGRLLSATFSHSVSGSHKEGSPGNSVACQPPWFLLPFMTCQPFISPTAIPRRMHRISSDLRS